MEGAASPFGKRRRED
ncbi:hypothetical protein E2C01_085857 [Portunus trituberculatus]|uniref:Uncharacterized protein n=1 Tax=Portunus trituberculatus TaxID=210409 RepID=A0A5B7JES4_PORTR|nr:hypothetical protein [Portunus trituberculatus]